MKETAKFSYEASPTQFKFLRLLSKKGVQKVSHECVDFKNDLTISSFTGQKISTEHSKCKRGQKQVHAIDKKELLPLKDVSTMNQQPIRFKLGPVCFQ